MYKTKFIHKYCGNTMMIPHPLKANMSANNDGNAEIQCFCRACKMFVNLNIYEYKQAWELRTSGHRKYQTKKGGA